MKRCDETPWWCQLLWPWFGPPWYAQIKDPDACLDAIRRQFARRAGELTDDLAGDDPPGEGYLAKAGRLIAARCQAEEVIRQEYGPLTSDDTDDGDEEDKAGPGRATAGRRGPPPSVMTGGERRPAGTHPRPRDRLTPALAGTIRPAGRPWPAGRPYPKTLCPLREKQPALCIPKQIAGHLPDPGQELIQRRTRSRRLACSPC
jgi:hypothetical protein